MRVKLDPDEYQQFQKMLRGNDYLYNTTSGESSDPDGESEDQRSSSSNNNLFQNKFQKKDEKSLGSGS